MRKLMFIMVFAVGCGSMPIPDPGSPEEWVARAQERGTDKNPEAQLHLKLARDGIAEAKKLKSDKKDDEAKLALLKAEADAEYALALLRRDTAKAEAEELKKKIEALKAEMGE